MLQPLMLAVRSAARSEAGNAPGMEADCAAKSEPPTTPADPHSGYRDAPNGSVSSAIISSTTPISRPDWGLPMKPPASVAATIGREIIACGKLTTSRPSGAPRSQIGNASARFTSQPLPELRAVEPLEPTERPER